MALRHSILDIDLGDTRADPLATERRSVIVTNLVFAALGILLPILGLILLVTGIDPYLGTAFIVVGLIRFGAVYLNLHGWSGTAVLLGIATGSILFLTMGVDFGEQSGVDIWAATFVALPPFIMGRKHEKLRPLVIVLVIGTVVVTHLLMYLMPPRVMLSPRALATMRTTSLVCVIAFMSIVLLVYRKMLDRAEERIAYEQDLSERLLGNILPAAIAARLKRDEYPIADGFDAVSVLFADVVSFTEFAAHQPPEAVVELLNRLFHSFDDMVERSGLEKIKTIGDAYMVAAGVPIHRDDHAAAIADLAIAMLDFVHALARERGEAIDLRIGIHSGPLVAGVIGKRKFSYDVWGDTVNIAARLQTASEPGRIQISEASARALGPDWLIEPRGAIALKGLGEMKTYFLLGRAAA